MKEITRKELINMYFDFFKEKDHKVIKSASLIPENDPTVLFTTAGMHPLVPNLLSGEHPEGKRLVNVQKCIRTSDIEEVGDDSHLTFFEMLGNWSLGDYFKKEMIPWSYEFLTSEKYLGIPKEKLYFTVFEGNEDAEKDIESYELWKNLGVSENHISFLDKKNNWWELGSGSGPCGPDTEMFYDTGKEKCDENCDPSCSCGKYLEIWNDVFMQYRLEDGKYYPLEHKNVDTGMGVERTITVLNGYKSVYDTECFKNVKEKLVTLTDVEYESDKKSFRVIMDHIRTITFILGDYHKLVPSNTGSGYVLRRLIRRTMNYMRKLNIDSSYLKDLALVIIEDYKNDYEELEINKDFIIEELIKESEKFNKTIKDGLKMFNKIIKRIDGNVIDGDNAFKLCDTFGIPVELTSEMALEHGLTVDLEGFHEKFKEHQEKSRTASCGEFKGGLADDSYETTKYHTLAHITLCALQEMFGEDTIQKGANITSERLRFDFNCDHKLTDEEKEQLTKRVNEIIEQNIDITKEIMAYEDAKKSGAEGIFADKYGEMVSVYTIGDFSKEICGGPHVNNTCELGNFKILKEESSSSGVRRLKIVMEERNK